MITLLCIGVLMHSAIRGSEAYVADTAEIRRYVATDHRFYYNDFEHYRDREVPWGGYRSSYWSVNNYRTAHTGRKILFGGSYNSGEDVWAVSEQFEVPGDVDYLTVSIQARFWNGRNTWQVVPQGAQQLVARFIVNPDGSVSVLDASTGGTPVLTSARVALRYLDESWEDIVFKIDRPGNRYRLFLNDVLIHSGVPFTLDLETIALVQTLNSAGAGSHFDTVIVEEDLTAVPTLSPTGLMALMLLMLISAIAIRRRAQRLKPAISKGFQG